MTAQQPSEISSAPPFIRYKPTDCCCISALRLMFFVWCTDSTCSKICLCLQWELGRDSRQSPERDSLQPTAYSLQSQTVAYSLQPTVCRLYTLQSLLQSGPVSCTESSDICGTSTRLTYSLYLVARQVLCLKCLKIQYWPLSHVLLQSTLDSK